MKRLFILVILLLSHCLLLSQDSITVKGYVILEYQTVYNDINVIFQRFVPDSITTNAKTDSSGYYEIKIAKGIYNISFEIAGFRSQIIKENPIYNNTTLDTVFLRKSALTGNISGVLNKFSYFIGEDISVSANDTLIIRPGAILKFDESVKFDIYGLLIANGSETDTIRFTADESSKRWGGIHFKKFSDSNSILDKCIVEYSGTSGITCDTASPKLKNLVVQDNEIVNTEYGEFNGGGINLLYSNSIVEHCIIRKNRITAQGGYYWAVGGGMSIMGGRPKVSNSYFTENYVFGSGGGIFLGYGTKALLTNCFIVQNRSEVNGAGISIHGDHGKVETELVNLTLAENTSAAANYTKGYSNVIGFGNYEIKANIVNCIFLDKIGAGTYFDRLQEIKIQNCIYWDYRNKNNLQDFDKWFGFSVQENVNNDSCDAYYNIIADPMFFNPENLDYRLNYDSPCIDAGTNDVDIDSVDFYGNERIFNYRGHNKANIDIGAYEFIEQPISVKDANLNPEQKLSIYPNPVVGKSIISFYLDKVEIVNLNIYDAYGRIILNILQQAQFEKGEHQIKIYRDELTSGIYFIVLQTNQKKFIGKVIVL